MKPLDSLSKRDLVAAKKFDAEEVRQYAREFLEQERFGDAFEFFRKLEDGEGIAAVKSAVIRVGDPEVLWRIEHFDRGLVSREDWIACGRSAMHIKKFRSAAYAFSRAGDEAGVAEAEKAFNPPLLPPESPGGPAPE
jgi:hypothetical protein